MKPASRFSCVLVTAPNLAVARKLAGVVLEGRLAACANLVPRLESHYWWDGKLESSAEVLILFKTTRDKLRALEQCVLENHPYDTPECITFSLQSGAERYLKWISDSVRAERRSSPDA